MFYMNMRAFNEGEQAEAYKKRKEEEKARKEDEGRTNEIRRAMTGSSSNSVKHAEAKLRKMTGNKNSNLLDDNIKSLSKNQKEELYNALHDKSSNNVSSSYSSLANREYSRRANDGKRMSDSEFRRAQDAANRHDRRHPKNECGIFESVEII